LTKRTRALHEHANRKFNAHRHHYRKQTRTGAEIARFPAGPLLDEDLVHPDQDDHLDPSGEGYDVQSGQAVRDVLELQPGRRRQVPGVVVVLLHEHAERRCHGDSTMLQKEIIIVRTNNEEDVQAAEKDSACISIPGQINSTQARIQSASCAYLHFYTAVVLEVRETVTVRSEVQQTEGTGKVYCRYQQKRSEKRII